MPNQKYLELQKIFYSFEYPDKAAIRYRYSNLQRLYSVEDIWITATKNVIPVVFMKSDHMLKAWEYFNGAIRDSMVKYEELARELPNDVFYLWDKTRFNMQLDRLFMLEGEFKRRKVSGYQVDSEILKFADLVNPDKDDLNYYFYSGEGHPSDYED